MAFELPTITIAELHKKLQAYIDQGLGDVPVVATDGRGRYPIPGLPGAQPIGPYGRLPSLRSP